jgi:hypothetical protein
MSDPTKSLQLDPGSPPNNKLERPSWVIRDRGGPAMGLGHVRYALKAEVKSGISI